MHCVLGRKKRLISKYSTLIDSENQPVVPTLLRRVAGVTTGCPRALSAKRHWRSISLRRLPLPLVAQVLKSPIKYTGADMTHSASLRSCTEGFSSRFTRLSLRRTQPRSIFIYICVYVATFCGRPAQTEMLPACGTS